jgi:CBS domain-containing protein
VPEPQVFLKSVPPFDQLSATELTRVAGMLTLGRYELGEPILRRLQPAKALYLVIDGIVDELDAAGPIAAYGPGSAFDAKALLQGRTEHTFVTRGRVTCFEMPSALFLALSRSNPQIREHYFSELSRRLDDLVAIQQQREAASFLMTRLGEGRLHPAVCVAPETSIGAATQAMQDNETTAVLVRRGDQVGIFTDRDVRERHVLMGLPLETPVGDLASYDLQTLDQDDFLFNALVLMSRLSIRHVVVTRGGEIVGVFEQADLLKYLSNSAYVISSRLERASSDEELLDAGNAIPRLIRSLFERGVKPRYITRVVTDLNRRLMRRVFERLTLPEMREQACLMVMGSEGRGEQLLRTDQDNGLILSDEPGIGDFVELAEAFNQTLKGLGYPPCPGNVMVANPEWRKPLADYKADLRRWVSMPDNEAFLTLAILYDGSAVAGDVTLLGELKSYLFQLLQSQQAFIGHFAKTTLSFPTPLNWFNRLATEKDETGAAVIDIKKGGIFPIVHGVRSLALEHRLAETNTIARVQAMSGRGPFSEEFTADIIEAFDFMLMLRMRQQFVDLDEGKSYDNNIDVERLTGFERNLLRDSLKIVREFKTYITEHFRLQMLT